MVECWLFVSTCFAQKTLSGLFLHAVPVCVRHLPKLSAPKPRICTEPESQIDMQDDE
jgi:hypothetical protein